MSRGEDSQKDQLHQAQGSSARCQQEDGCGAQKRGEEGEEECSPSHLAGSRIHLIAWEGLNRRFGLPLGLRVSTLCRLARGVVDK